MHVMIPFASVLAEAGQQALQTLALPHLEALLARMKPAARDAADEYSLSPPHERALARELGFEGADGTLPWAAHCASRHGIETGAQALGLLTPAHWRIGADQVTMLDPDALALDEAESRALCEAVHELCEGVGWRVQYGAPLTWYAAHPSLAEQPCASLDRVIGRGVDAWLVQDTRVRRLQNEAQMLLHRHPLNEAREARDALAVNSFWLSGCGVAQPAHETAALRFDGRLRAGALAEDWAAWAEAWHALDAGPLAELLAAVQRGERATLTLCGERVAQRYESAPRTLWARLTSLGKQPAAPLLQAL